jgi:hypothetical protein
MARGGGRRASPLTDAVTARLPRRDTGGRRHLGVSTVARRRPPDPPVASPDRGADRSAGRVVTTIDISRRARLGPARAALAAVTVCSAASRMSTLAQRGLGRAGAGGWGPFGHDRVRSARAGREAAHRAPTEPRLHLPDTDPAGQRCRAHERVGASPVRAGRRSSRGTVDAVGEGYPEGVRDQPIPVR